MKYKKQLRWLLLMLIPFIIMLGIHLIIPISIASNSQACASSNYLLSKVNAWENVASYNTVASTYSIQNILNRYARFIHFFNGFTLLSNNRTFLNLSISINSAHLFNSQILNSSQGSVKEQSMWFATNVTNPLNLSPTLKAIFDRYLSMEAYLRALLVNSMNSTLKSISVLFVSSNQSIVFEYPTKYNPNYLSINSSSQGPIYTQILSQSSISSMSSIAMIQQVPQQNKSLLVLCKWVAVESIVMIPCIHLDIDLLGNDILGSINMTGPNFFKTYLATCIYQDDIRMNKLPEVVIQILNGNRSLTYSNATINLTNTGVTSNNFVLNSTNPSEELFITKSRNLTSYISSISFPNNNQSTILLRVYTQSIPQVASNIKTINILSSLKAVLIPNGILILIGSMISALVLKILLDSLDKELYELDKMCQFIVEGDINIQISEHKGTEDIREVYNKVRIINKIHRCSTSSYFSGHFAEKLLKYNEALQFLKSLKYDTANVLENMGEVATHLEQWDKAISYYKQSIELGLALMKEKFNLTMEDILKIKKQKGSFPQRYKQMETIMIRRMMKLHYTHVKYIEMRSTFTKVDKAESSNQQEFKNRMDKITQDSSQNLRLLKICYYPHFSSYSESIIILLFEARHLANMKRFEEAKDMLDIVGNFNKIYTEQYPIIKQKLKQVGSKFKLFRQRNKLTPHSRIHPEVMKILINLFSSKIIAASTESYDKLNTVTELLIDSTKTAYLTLSLGYMVVVELRKLLITLKIDPTRFESTQIFKQAVPFKTLYYGEITKDAEPQLMKFPTKTSLGLERQFVFLVDCAQSFAKNQYEYYQDRANYIYQKLLKPTDRLSIIKFNLKNGIKIQCNLILKQLNEEMLKKQINSCFKQPLQAKGSLEQIVEGLYRTVNRIKALQCEKIIVMFFKTIAYYSHLHERKKKKKADFLMDALTQEEFVEEEVMSDFGFHVIEALSADSLRNCKLIIYCARNDTINEFRTFFGLKDINRRLWKGCNSKNNLVYVIQEKHKSDIDRILMLKTQDVPDNHVFIL